MSMANGRGEELPRDSFQKYILISAGLHIAVVLAFTMKVFFFPSDPLVFQSALRVDLVALPDKIAAPAPSAPPPSEAPSAAAEKKTEPAPDPEPTVNLNPTKPTAKAPKKADEKIIEKKQESAINRLKQQSAIERMEEQFRQEEANKARTFKGNVISKGSELSGLSQLEHDEYVAQVERHIRQHWALPQWLANKDLKAQVRVRFAANGVIIAKQLVKSSGNPAFDEVVLSSVEAASPAPPPPARLARLLEYEGILFGFPE